MSKCLRCGRELKDPNAIYGWRCEEIVNGGATTIKQVDTPPEKWTTRGYRVAYQQGERLLDLMGVNTHDIDQTLFFDAIADFMIAEYQGDFDLWEKSFWEIVSALYPIYSDGKLIPASVETTAMSTYISVVQALEDLGLKQSTSRIEK